MQRIHVYTADDGTQFKTATECKQYESGGQLLDILSGRSPKEIGMALDRTSPDLADALELAGNIIAKRRRASGQLKRVVKKEQM